MAESALFEKSIDGIRLCLSEITTKGSLGESGISMRGCSGALGVKFGVGIELSGILNFDRRSIGVLNLAGTGRVAGSIVELSFDLLDLELSRLVEF